MVIPTWFIGYFLAILGFNLLVVWLVIRRTAIDRDDTDEPGGGIVRCEACGEENEGRFQFCQSCLNELPKKPVGPHQ